MTEHHPLCPFDPDATDPTGECQCALIARVRDNTAEKIAQAIERARIALPDETPSYHGTTRSRDDMSFALAQARDIAHSFKEVSSDD
jgi:hypothetical protein